MLPPIKCIMSEMHSKCNAVLPTSFSHQLLFQKVLLSPTFFWWDVAISLVWSYGLKCVPSFLPKIHSNYKGFDLKPTSHHWVSIDLCFSPQFFYKICSSPMFFYENVLLTNCFSFDFTSHCWKTGVQVTTGVFACFLLPGVLGFGHMEPQNLFLKFGGFAWSKIMRFSKDQEQKLRMARKTHSKFVVYL